MGDIWAKCWGKFLKHNFIHFLDQDFSFLSKPNIKLDAEVYIINGISSWFYIHNIKLNIYLMLKQPGICM
ncbi:hypothetical protein Ahy_A01g003943 isoform B [Arachis hypogaea]|uniref:Uncharacterized protein n=1 Tax=Arachis hypogaea TaxID=3818 RepID=A0A445EUN8_ARAHY|nr:hypothetical protein Ahy_A01g003943 isoform B [Arachis hypogaea]